MGLTCASQATVNRSPRGRAGAELPASAPAGRARRNRELEKCGPQEEAGWVHDHHTRGDWEKNREGYEREVARRLGVQMARLHARSAFEDAGVALSYVLGELKDANRDVKWAAEGVEKANQRVFSELTEHELAQHELDTLRDRYECSCELCAMWCLPPL